MGEGVALLQELANKEASRRNDEVLIRALRGTEEKYIRAPYIPINLAQWKMMSPEAQDKIVERMRSDGHQCLSTMLRSIAKPVPMPAHLDYSGLSLGDLPASEEIISDLVAVHGVDIIDRSGPPYCWKCDEIPCKCFRKYAYDSYCDLHRRLNCPTCA